MCEKTEDRLPGGTVHSGPGSGAYEPPLDDPAAVRSLEDRLRWERQRNRRLLSDLRRNEEKYRAIYQASPDAVSISELEGKYIDINEGYTRTTGYTREDVLGRSSLDVGIWVDPADRERLIESIEKDGYCGDLECPFRCKNGEIRTGLLSARTIPFGGKQRLITVVRDITEQKNAERRTRELLEEKELLLREVYHRVKNNMASIASLLSLQAGSSKTPEVRDALHEMGNRIRSIQVVYDKLFHSQDFERISFGEYLDDMLEITRSSLPAGSAIALESKLEDIPLEANRIFPLGLIANELVTNAIKYAFPEGRAGTIRVSLSRTDPGWCVLSVSDDGRGFPEDLDPENSTGFGLTLVSALTAQIRGRLTFLRAGGTEVRIRFPETAIK